MKKKIIITVTIILLLALVGVGGVLVVNIINNKPISDLSGTWRQVNNDDPDSYQEAIIKEGYIEVYWVSDGGETKALYWAGSYEAPESKVSKYSWESVNDKEKTDSGWLTSSADTKTFTYENGQLCYETSAMGTTTVRKLEKID